MQVTRIIAIRHGETAWNVDARIQGSLDIPLNATGLWQAERTGMALAEEALDAVISSDLSRAYATALKIGKPHGLEPQTEAGLRERRFGEFEGKTFSEVEQTRPEDARRWKLREVDFAPPNGESLLQFRERIIQTVQSIANAHIGKSVAIVAHGGVMDVLYRAATAQSLDAPRTWALGNAAINRLLWNGVHFTLVGWNDHQHLAEGSLNDQVV